MAKKRSTAKPRKKRGPTHDSFFRANFGTVRIARAIVKKALPPETVACLDLKKLTIERRDLQNDELRDMVTDVIYKIPIKNTKKAIHFFPIFEHKSDQDHLTIFQIWRYVYLLCSRLFREAWERKEVDANYQLPPVIAIIIYHGKSKFRCKTELAEMFYPLPGLERYLPRMLAILFDLSTIDDNDPVLNDPEVPELRIVLMVMKIVFRNDVVPKLKEVLEEMKPYSDDSEMRRVIQTTFAFLVNNVKYFRENPKELFGMFREFIGDDVMTTIIDTWKAEGRAEAEAVSAPKWKAESAANIVLKLLQNKFNKVPKRIENAVRSMTDPTALESLAVHVMHSQSLKEFEEALT